MTTRSGSTRHQATPIHEAGSALATYVLPWRRYRLAFAMTNESSIAASQNGFFGKLLKPFRPAPPAEVQFTDPKVVAPKYRYWQTRVLFSSIIGYATFYFVRANL